MSDAKGPYRHETERFGILFCNPRCYACIHEKGFSAGRASRDGLREALVELLDHHAGRICSEVDEARGYRKCSDVVNQASKALKADEAGE